MEGAALLIENPAPTLWVNGHFLLGERELLGAAFDTHAGADGVDRFIHAQALVAFVEDLNHGASVQGVEQQGCECLVCRLQFEHAVHLERHGDLHLLNLQNPTAVVPGGGHGRGVAVHNLNLLIGEVVVRVVDSQAGQQDRRARHEIVGIADFVDNLVIHNNGVGLCN